MPSARSSSKAAEHLLRGERREAEGRLVGDEHLRGLRQRWRQAEHLLLPTRDQARALPAPLGKDREPLVGLVALRGCPQQDPQVLLDGQAGEDPAGFRDEQRAPAGRARRLGQR